MGEKKMSRKYFISYIDSRVAMYACASVGMGQISVVGLISPLVITVTDTVIS